MPPHKIFQSGKYLIFGFRVPGWRIDRNPFIGPKAAAGTRIEAHLRPEAPHWGKYALRVQPPKPSNLDQKPSQTCNQRSAGPWNTFLLVYLLRIAICGRPDPQTTPETLLEFDRPRGSARYDLTEVAANLICADVDEAIIARIGFDMTVCTSDVA
ncbi:MAG: hypothetical protein JSV78_14970 [Phycisphaerales bacterium]|nr:MAG: hypothetical protein JSV78_14970 [Phycisphaerales bacterium]